MGWVGVWGGGERLVYCVFRVGCVLGRSPRANCGGQPECAGDERWPWWRPGLPALAFWWCHSKRHNGDGVRIQKYLVGCLGCVQDNSRRTPRFIGLMVCLCAPLGSHCGTCPEVPASGERQMPSKLMITSSDSWYYMVSGNFFDNHIRPAYQGLETSTDDDALD